MDFRRAIVRLLACVATALLASCIDGREEVWVNADGSGRAEVSYSLPAAAARFQGGEAGVRRMIEGFLKDAPGISNSSCEVTTEGDRLKIRVRTTFDSALELQQISKGEAMSKLPSSATGLTGDFQVAVKGLSIDFARTIKAGDTFPGAGFIPVSVQGPAAHLHFPPAESRHLVQRHPHRELRPHAHLGFSTRPSDPGPGHHPLHRAHPVAALGRLHPFGPPSPFSLSRKLFRRKSPTG